MITFVIGEITPPKTVFETIKTDLVIIDNKITKLLKLKCLLF